MKRKYTNDELRKLHEYLYKILGEIVRICEKCDISYYIIGGSGIGALFEQAIIPWDDDIDIGMTRDNYNRFLKIAPSELKPDFFLQWINTDYHTPFSFAKIRLDNTAFVEGVFKKLDIHHGIFVDIFPFDKVPDNQFLQKTQRFVANFLNGCFMGKDIWQWKYFGKCDVEEPRQRGRIPCLLTRFVDFCFSKKTIYRMLCWSQTIFNRWDTTYYNLVLTRYDHISVKNIEQLQHVPFGPLTVTAPSDLEIYLRHHYPKLRRYIPEEEQENHRPEYLSFECSYKVK